MDKKESLKVLAETFTALRAINKMRENIKRGENTKNIALELRKRIALMREKGIEINEDQLKAFNIAALEAGPSIVPENMLPVLKYMENFVESVLPTIPEEYMPTEVKSKILTQIKEQSIIDVDELKSKTKTVLSKEEEAELEDIEVEMDLTEPRRELVKSFLIMSEALNRTIVSLDAAIEELSSYLDSVDVKVEVPTPTPAEKPIPETDNSKTPTPEEAETTSKETKGQIEKEVEEEQKKIEEESALFNASKTSTKVKKEEQEEKSEVSSAISNVFAAPMKR